MNADTTSPIVLVPGDRFFVKSVPLDPAVAAAGQVEIALEESSPFPLAQVYHGFVLSADGTQALGYAAYRRRFPPAELTAWAGAAVVLPDFIALFGPPPAEPLIVIQSHADGLNGVAWDGHAGLPVAVMAQALADPTDTQIDGMATGLRRLSGLDETEVRKLSGPVGAGTDDAGGAIFRVGGHETMRLSSGAVAAADVRDKSFLGAKRREDRRRRGWKLALLGVGLLWLLAAGLEMSDAAIGLWNKRRLTVAARQGEEVQRIETANAVAARIEDLAARQERPLEWLAMAGAARPRSLQFLRAASKKDRTLEIEVQTAVAGDAGTYEAALRRLTAVEQVETHDLRSREGLTTFVVALKFKPAAGVAGGGRP